MALSDVVGTAWKKYLRHAIALTAFAALPATFGCQSLAVDSTPPSTKFKISGDSNSGSELVLSAFVSDVGLIAEEVEVAQGITRTTHNDYSLPHSYLNNIELYENDRRVDFILPGTIT